jgi:hypothetical protein
MVRESSDTSTLPSPAWSLERTPNVTGASANHFTGVSCTSNIACQAVGYATTGGRSVTTVTMAERWNGASWSLERTLNPAGASNNYFTGVSCSSTTACLAVGYAAIGGFSGGTTLALAERWNGTRWLSESPPKPTGASNTSLAGVSCTSNGVCQAVGDATIRGTTLALAERWNGTGWLLETTRKPSGAFNSSLAGVSCTSTIACQAVGGAYTNSGLATLAESWNGTRWSLETTPPKPAGAFSNSFAAVSCASASACQAVGDIGTRSGQLTTAEGWNGTRWSLETTPKQAKSSTAFFQGVSCTAKNACQAVGYATTGTVGFGFVTMAEGWNGTTWSSEHTPNPAGALSVLAGASCTSTRACQAVGYAETLGVNGKVVTLAERRL